MQVKEQKCMFCFLVYLFITWKSGRLFFFIQKYTVNQKYLPFCILIIVMLRENDSDMTEQKNLRIHKNWASQKIKDDFLCVYRSFQDCTTVFSSQVLIKYIHSVARSLFLFASMSLLSYIYGWNNE